MPVLADFHNHSCLSPCGSLEMSPRVLVDLARRRGVEILALTDHNSALNCPAFAKVCALRGMLPVFGLEATTSEEIHVLCLFTSLEACMVFDKFAAGILVSFPNNPQKDCDQVYVDENDFIIGEVDSYLVSPLDISIDDIGAKVIEYGGIVIPAHIDRPYFSMVSQLGAVVRGPWSAVECVRIPPGTQGVPLDTLGYNMITSSDAHHPEHVARRPFRLNTTIEEIAPHGLSGEVDMKVLKRVLNSRPK